MSHWNYRVMHDPKTGFFQIHETHYDDDEDQTPHSWTDSIDPFGYSVTELRDELQRMLTACEKEVLPFS